MATPLLQVSGLEVYYGMIQALRAIEIEVHEGEIVALIGANGAGKTTLLKAITGLLRPRAGRILLAGQDIQAVPAHRRVRQGLVMVPEGRGIFPNLTVRENLLLGAYRRQSERAAVNQDLARVLELFPRLAERLHQAGGTLSGGEQQMLAIGRALMSQPRLLLLDEPSMGLAPVLIPLIFSIIRQIRDSGTTVFLVEQNANAALRSADRAYVLEVGNVVRTGPASALLDEPEVRMAYLGN